MASIDGTLEWLVDESTGQVVGQKRRDGVEVGIVTTQTNPLTGRIKSTVAGEANALITVSVGGDSYIARTHQAVVPTALTVAGGICTVVAVGHGAPTGELCNVTGAADEAVNVVRAPVTRIDANTFTYPCPGAAAGVVSAGAATPNVLLWSQPTIESIPMHLSRLSGGGIQVVANAGCSGYKMAAYAARRAVALDPYPADLHIHWGYLNDCAQGVSVADSVSTVKADLLANKKRASTVALVSPLPINSGTTYWTTVGSVMTDATAAVWVAQWRQEMADWCANNDIVFIDIYRQTIDPATGYARTGVCKSADIHPSEKTQYDVAKLIYAALKTAVVFKTRSLPISANETIASDSTSRNVCRKLPIAIGAGGSVGSGVTNTYTAWTASTVVAAQRWRTNAGNLYYTAAGGTTGTTAPTHTSGSVSDGGVTWLYVGRADGTAGVPEGWGVYGGTTCLALSALIDKLDGSKALRATVVAGAANDQLRISYTATASDIAALDTLSAALSLDVSTAIAASAKSPQGQNIKAITAQIVATVDGVTYTYYEARSGAGAAAEMQTDDVSCVAVVPFAPIPSGSVTLVRVDILVQFLGAGVAQVVVGSLSLTH